MNDMYVGQSPMERGDHDVERDNEPMTLRQSIESAQVINSDGYVAFSPEAWSLINSSLTSREAEGYELGSPDDLHVMFEAFVAAEIDRAPEALRRLGEYLSDILDADNFNTANRMLLSIACATPAAPGVAQPKGEPVQPVEALDVEAGRDLVKRLRHTPNWLREQWGDFKSAGANKYDSAPKEAAECIETLIAALAHPRSTGDVWTCFHCGETFTGRSDAALHFGTRESQYPACTIDIAAYRVMEAKEARYCDEDADIHRQMHRMGSEHRFALQLAEEAGYAKALKDTGYTPPTGEQAGKVVHVEARRCDVCDHIGVNDASDTQGACHNCDWRGDEQKDDLCPECAATSCMAPACPECGGRYCLVANAEVSTQPRPVGVPDMWLSEQDGGEFADMTAGQAYRRGWNDCRQAMLTTATAPVSKLETAVGVPDGWVIDDCGNGMVRIESPTHELFIGFMPPASVEATTMLRDLACALLAAAPEVQP